MQATSRKTKQITMTNYFTKTVFLLVATITIISCGGGKAGKKEERKQKMEIEAFVVTASLLDNMIKTTGSILPNEKMELRSEVSGRIDKLGFAEGTQVRKGAILVQIDDSELLAQLQKLTAQLRIAKEDESRKLQLLAINGISQEIYDASLARLEELGADIALTNSKIRKSKIIAPFSGKIGLRMVSEGAWVSTGEIISTLVQTDPIKVEFSVPERYAVHLMKGMNVCFTISGLEEPVDAEIYATEPQIDASTRSMRVRALTSNKSGQLIPGAFAELSINLGTIEEALMVPTLTLVPLLNSQNLYVVKNGRANLVEVQTGIRNEKMIQITQGIANGDTIATSGLLSLKDFMPVSVIKTEK